MSSVMSSVLSAKEVSQGRELIDSIITKLHSELVKASKNKEEFKRYYEFMRQVKDYTSKQDVALRPRLDNLNKLVSELLASNSVPGQFAITRYSTSDLNELSLMGSPALFNVTFYDVAELIAVVEFSYLHDIVYGCDESSGMFQYKANNELNYEYGIISRTLELILDEDPENFYDEEVRAINEKIHGLHHTIQNSCTAENNNGV